MKHISLILSAISLLIYKTHPKDYQQLNETQMLFKAVQNNRLTELADLLKKGANVNTVNQQHKSLLLVATEKQFVNMAKLLIEYGADVNLQDNRLESPFLTAAVLGNSELIALYLENGARFDVFNRYYGTALIPACERGHVEIVKMLTQTPYLPLIVLNKLGWTALLETIILGDGSQKYVTIVQQLIEAGCDIHITDNNGVTPLQHAQKNGHTKIINLLKNAPRK